MKKLKKIIAAALSAALTMAVPSVHLHADENFIISADDSRYKYLENADGTISVAASEYSQTGISGTVKIPDKLDGKTVTGICKSGFSGRNITDVTVPQTVTSIGSLAFANCLSLSAVNLPKGITYMGELAFSSTSFETNLFKSSDPDFAVIDDYILYLYTGNESVIEVPDGIKLIANSAFANNGINSQTDITSVSLPDGVRYIGDNVFENCNNLGKIVIKTGLESVGKNSVPKKALIYGYTGTYAESFAKSNGNTFVPLIKDGEYKLECEYDENFKQYYFSTDTQFSREGVHVYKRFSDGSRTEITDWKFDSSPNLLYQQANN